VKTEMFNPQPRDQDRDDRFETEMSETLGRSWVGQFCIKSVNCNFRVMKLSNDKLTNISYILNE